MGKMNNYDNWYKMILKHLSEYKTNILNVPNDGIWKGNGKPYSHILPLEFGSLNYLCEEAKSSLKEDEKHKDWYHLNSSQTLCVNFFAPLKESDGGKHLSALLSHILQKQILIAKACFEYVPVKNSTNFDFYAEDNFNNKYYFEIKYTEKGIAKSGGGKNPQEAYNLYYKDDVDSNEAFTNVDRNMFMNKHFQSYRNMVKGKGNNYSVFITMKNNPSTFKELQEAIKDLRVDNLPNVVVLFWEELIDDSIALFKNNPILCAYYKKLKSKYIPK